MSSVDQSAIEISDVNENYPQNFILDCFTAPLARKLAVAAFMDLRPEAAQMQSFHNRDIIYNEGSIITEADNQSPGISQSVLHNFKSMLIGTWKRLFAGRK